MRCGLYGKLPAKRDFVAISAPREFLAVWEPWLQGSISASRLALGNSWQAVFLRAPIWRFWLGAGLSGNTIAGAFMPSVDGVGRYFPLTAFAYAEGKWSIKEVLSHLIDGERMFAYRLFRISRGDKTPIEGFEQDGYIENANANGRSFGDLLEEFSLLRRANLMLVKNLNDEGWSRVGTANQVNVTARALTYIMAGHIEHHLGILKERYLA